MTKKATEKNKMRAEMALVQRSYWLQKEDVISLDDLRNAALRESDLENIDLSAALRGIIAYASEIIEEKQERDHEFRNIIKAIVYSVNPNRRGSK